MKVFQRKKFVLRSNTKSVDKNLVFKFLKNDIDKAADQNEVKSEMKFWNE